MILAPSGNELTFLREYDGANSPNGNADFTMKAVYEKSTEEELAIWSAKGRGIEFVKVVSWNKVLEKAKKEKKLIFY